MNYDGYVMKHDRIDISPFTFVLRCTIYTIVAVCIVTWVVMFSTDSRMSDRRFGHSMNSISCISQRKVTDRAVRSLNSSHSSHFGTTERTTLSACPEPSNYSALLI